MDALVIEDDAPEAEEATPPAKAKRKSKKTISPTARTLVECRRRGWIAGVVEKNVQYPKPHKIDLFGVIDIVAIVPAQHDLLGAGAILAIQATSNNGGTHAARRDKILAEPRAKAWVDAGGRLELWSWAKQGAAGKRKTWTLRVETYAEMVAGASEGA